jgi:hypothetical protein
VRGFNVSRSIVSIPLGEFGDGIFSKHASPIFEINRIEGSQSLARDLAILVLLPTWGVRIDKAVAAFAKWEMTPRQTTSSP